MKRPVLASFALGSLAGCIAAYQDAPPHRPMPTTKVKAPLECWHVDAAPPGFYGAMAVLEQDVPGRLAVLGRNGHSVLVGQFGSRFCILGEMTGA